MPVSSTDIVNQALQMIGGNNSTVQGAYPAFGPDNSAQAKAANALYGPCVQTVGRQFEWDFARRTVALALTGNAAPFPWSFEYGYPSNGIEVWAVIPAAEVDPNNPIPYNFAVANAVYGAPPAQGRVIHTNLTGAMAVYNNNPTENTWDASFREAVVRLLASELAMAIAGKPDVAEGGIQSFAAFEKIGEQRQN